MNKWDKIYQDGTRFTPLNEIFLYELLAYIKRQTDKTPTTVVDLGCGDGSDLHQFSRQGIGRQTRNCG